MAVGTQVCYIEPVVWDCYVSPRPLFLCQTSQGNTTVKLFFSEVAFNLLLLDSTTWSTLLDQKRMFISHHFSNRCQTYSKTDHKANVFDMILAVNCFMVIPCWGFASFSSPTANWRPSFDKMKNSKGFCTPAHSSCCSRVAIMPDIDNKLLSLLWQNAI